MILGIAGLLIIYKMIDTEVPVLYGLPALVFVLFLLALVVSTPSGLLQAIIFVVALAGLASFQYLADQVEQAELRKFDTERLIEVYNKYMERPDNVSAVFDIAKRLYAHGMKGNAIALATTALNTLSQNLDPVSNRSFRDTFRNEEYMLKNWNREAAKNPAMMRPLHCPSCKTVNPLENFYCRECGRPYLLDIAYDMRVKPTIYGKLLLAFVIVGLVIVGSAFVGVAFSGMMAVVALVLLLGSAYAIIRWMFAPPVPLS